MVKSKATTKTTKKTRKKLVVKKGTNAKGRVGLSNPTKKKKTDAPCKQKKGLHGFFRLNKFSDYMTSDVEFGKIMSLPKEEGVLSPILDEVKEKVLEMEEELQLKKKAMKDTFHAKKTLLKR